MDNWLIAGLGNPGAKYEYTRHNVGSLWLDKLAHELAITLAVENKFYGQLAQIHIDKYKVYLLKPLKFMNNSGQSVAALANFHKIPTSNILIVHDELDLPVGTARLKYGGGHGGHNGLRDIVTQIGSNNFLRCRLGIAYPEVKRQALGYVINLPSQIERRLILSSINNSMKILPDIVSDNLEKAMQWLHSR